MILDSCKLLSVTIQIEYQEAFEIWDHSGAITRRLSSIWSDLSVSEAQPHQQVLNGKNLRIQTGITKSTVTLTGEKSLVQNRINQLKDTFAVWREELALETFNRVSTRIQYVKNYNSIKEANAQLFSLNLAKWPETKVFDQPTDSDYNSLELRYRFQDKESFSILTFKTEQIIYQVDLDPSFVEEYEIKKTENRLMVDFDRGLLGSVSADKFRIDEWIKGFQHLLRRDIVKIIQE
jgi:hypothetical protein